MTKNTAAIPECTPLLVDHHKNAEIFSTDNRYYLW